MAVIGVRSQGEAVASSLCRDIVCKPCVKPLPMLLVTPGTLSSLLAASEIFCRWERGPQVQVACVPGLQHEVCIAWNGHLNSVSWEEEWALVLSISSLVCSMTASITVV